MPQRTIIICDDEVHFAADRSGDVDMFTEAAAVASAFAGMGLGRRSLLAMALFALAPFGGEALADALPDPAATISRLNAALLAAMKSVPHTSFSRRFEALAPEVDRAFDLPSVLSVSVGPGWATLAPDQQARLLDAFRRYTVASYVASFDDYAGQSFSVAPDSQSLGADRVVVKSHITPAKGDAVELDYVLKQSSAGWKVVDVLAAGSISRVAVQRSDFRRLLSGGGGDALVSSLQRKAFDLSGGALV
jgi:phospholipid transport system substrate-binding protein